MQRHPFRLVHLEGRENRIKIHHLDNSLMPWIFFGQFFIDEDDEQHDRDFISELQKTLSSNRGFDRFTDFPFLNTAVGVWYGDQWHRGVVTQHLFYEGRDSIRIQLVDSGDLIYCYDPNDLRKLRGNALEYPQLSYAFMLDDRGIHFDPEAFTHFENILRSINENLFRINIIARENETYIVDLFLPDDRNICEEINMRLNPAPQQMPYQHHQAEQEEAELETSEVTSAPQVATEAVRTTSSPTLPSTSSYQESHDPLPHRVEKRKYMNDIDISHPTKKQKDTDLNNVPDKAIEEITNIPIQQLTMGEDVMVHSCQYYSPDKFFVGLYKENVCSSKDIDVGLLEPVTSVILGNYYTAHDRDDPNGTWRRVQVLAINGNKIEVLFDDGNEAIIDLSTLRKLSEENSRKFKFPAIECCLKTDKTKWTDEECDQFATWFCTDNKLKVRFLSEVRENVFSVILYDNCDEPVNTKFGATSDCLFVKPVILNADIDDNTHVEIINFNNPADFYIKTSDTSSYISLIKQIKDIRTVHNIKTVEENMYALVFLNDEDKNLHRAKICNLNGDTAKVFLLDYGYSAVIKHTHIFALPEYMSAIPARAIHCGINNITLLDDKSPEGSHKMNNIFSNPPYKVKIYEKTDDGKLLVDLINTDGKCVKQCLIDHALAVTLTKPPSTGYLFTSGTSFAVTVSEFSNLNYFHIQLKHQQSELKKLEEKLNFNTELLGDIVRETNAIVAAKDNDMWWRAKILEVNENYTKVEFIDYGCTSAVSEIRKLPPDFDKIPPYAYKCRLPILDNDCTDDMIGRYKNIIMRERDNTTVKAYKNHEGVWIVDLIINDVSLMKSIEETYPNNTKIFRECFVLNYESPSKIGIQIVDDLNQFQIETDIMDSEVDSWETISVDNLEIGEIYYVRITENVWYRCKLTKINPREVEYMDYFNSVESVTEDQVFKKLPDEYKIKPKPWKYCKLVKQPTNIKHFESDIQDFIYTDDKTVSIIIHNEDNDWLTVSLLKDEKMLYEEITDLQVAPSAIPTNTKFRVVFFESTQSFYIQLLENDSKFNDLQNKIQECVDFCADVESTLPYYPTGSMYVCLYKNNWYRSKIMNDADKNQLLLIDVGETISLTSDIKLKNLPGYLKNIEAFAIKCILNNHESHQDDDKLASISEILREKNAIFEAFININNTKDQPLVLNVYKNEKLIELMEEPFDTNPNDEN